MRFLKLFRAAAAALSIFPAGHACAGVTNPDISALGQVLGGYTNDPASADADEPTLKLGEAEILLDAYLNPYFKGGFTLSAGVEGVGLEEAWTSMFKGLPWGLGFKAGKYRLGFGNLNAFHPHAYPFIAPPRAMASLLFGEEGFNETAAQVSALLPTPGDWAATVSVDMLEGAAFHEGQEGTRLGWLGRWANDFLLGESGALQVGLSGATGTDDLARESRAYLAGADIKAKLPIGESDRITLQAEAVYRRDHALDSAASTEQERTGFLGFCEYRFHTRWSGGLMYERWEPDGSGTADQAMRAFAGFSVLEESTIVRLAFERFLPDGADQIDTATLQLLFSMGPHKAHRF